jgi:hypothetical protein
VFEIPRADLCGCVANLDPATDEDEEPEQPAPQRRRKHDKSLSIVERMETIMGELKDLLPKEHPLRSVIYEILRNLGESEPSAA